MMPGPLDAFNSQRNTHTDNMFNRGATSNLTLGLREAGAAGNGAPMGGGVGGVNIGNTSGSITHSNGIPMGASRIRRESMRDPTGSLNGRMSWGGVSVGSWIMDDYIMAGTSPFNQQYQSPSYHSSSYLPKLEAQFFKDFSCCNLRLPSLHELLQHYEECHAHQQMPPLGGMELNNGHDNSRQHPPSNQQNMANHMGLLEQASRGAGVTSPISGMGGIGASMRQQQLAAAQQIHYAQQMNSRRSAYGQRQQEQDDHDNEAIGEMDMDTEDLTPPSHPPAHTPQHPHQQMRLSSPGTPAHTMSSVNTPTLPHATLELPRHIANHPAFSPESSVPGTPSGLEHPEFPFPHHGMIHQGFVPVTPTQQQQHQQNLAGDGIFGDLGDMCIDEPAKNLYSRGGYGITAAQMQQLKYGVQGIPHNIGNMSNGGRVAGVQGLPIGGVEEKPFKCPVVGCEKAYKNQNGLKYHKAHGHTNQTLCENEDGTLSIVNPETSAPYPGTLGMEKEKPYKCEACGKRYKNLNGLKYHRAHSTHGNVGMPGQPPLPTSGVVAVAGGVAGEDGMAR